MMNPDHKPAAEDSFKDLVAPRLSDQALSARSEALLATRMNETYEGIPLKEIFVALFQDGDVRRLHMGAYEHLPVISVLSRVQERFREIAATEADRLDRKNDGWRLRLDLTDRFTPEGESLYRTFQSAVVRAGRDLHEMGIVNHTNSYGDIYRLTDLGRALIQRLRKAE
jgi:hypothetical protein